MIIHWHIHIVHFLLFYIRIAVQLLFDSEKCTFKFRWLKFLNQVCRSLQRDIYTITSPLSFLQARCPSCHPTNSVKSLKAICYKYNTHSSMSMNTCTSGGTITGLITERLHPEGKVTEQSQLVFNVPFQHKYMAISRTKGQGWRAIPTQYRKACLLYTSPSPRDRQKSRMPSSA